MPRHARPFPIAEHLGLLLDLGHHLCRRKDQLGIPRRLRGDLDIAGPLQALQLLEGVLDTDACGQQAMVTQDHHALVAQVGHQTLTFVQVQGHAFVTVIGHAPRECDGMLGNRQQAVLLRRHRNAVAGMGVQHRLQVMACAVDGAVDHVAGVVDPQASGVVDEGAVEVDLDQIGGSNFIEQQPEGVDQEMLVGARYTGGKVGVDVIGPLVQGRQAVGGGQFYAYLPFLWRDALADGIGNTG